MGDEAEFWDRQSGESAKAFSAFTLYRDAGPERRSIARVAEELRKSVGLLNRWSRQYRWVERVEAYDRHLDKKAREEVEREKIANRKQRLGASKYLLSKAVTGLQAQHPEGRTETTVGEDGQLVKVVHPPWKPHELIRALDVANKHLRKDYDDEPGSRDDVDPREAEGTLAELSRSMRDVAALIDLSVYDKELEEEE